MRCVIKIIYFSRSFLENRIKWDGESLASCPNHLPVEVQWNENTIGWVSMSTLPLAGPEGVPREHSGLVGQPRQSSLVLNTRRFKRKSLCPLRAPLHTGKGTAARGAQLLRRQLGILRVALLQATRHWGSSSVVGFRFAIECVLSCCRVCPCVQCHHSRAVHYAA